MTERAGLPEGISLNGGGNGVESGTETGTPVTFLPFQEQITNSYRQMLGTVAPREVAAVQRATVIDWESKRSRRSSTVGAAVVGWR